MGDNLNAGSVPIWFSLRTSRKFSASLRSKVFWLRLRCRLLALPFLLLECKHKCTTYTAHCLVLPFHPHHAARPEAPAVFASFSSKPWFRCYCRALLESDPALAEFYIQDAVITINQKLHDLNLEDDEREAMHAAAHYLKLIRNSAISKRA